MDITIYVTKSFTGSGRHKLAPVENTERSERMKSVVKIKNNGKINQNIL